MELSTVEAALAGRGFEFLGGFHPEPDDGAPAGAGTMLLAGPHPSGFWPRFVASPEAAGMAAGGEADPLDRFTARTLGALAEGMGARALFPFGGPPWLPFLAWAARAGRIWRSPVGLLVHAEAGLFVSFRGALAFPGTLALPPPEPRPCDGCPAPCRTACPAGALGPAGYDVPACRDWIAAPTGGDCLMGGCAVRRACPVGRGRWPPTGQRAFHMAAFRGRQRP